MRTTLPKLTISIKPILALVIVLIIALFLRLPLLNGSFWLDEAAQALESARPLAEQTHIAQDFQPPLLHFLVHFAMAVSKEEWWLRTIGALIPGLITVGVTYSLGTKIQDKKTGILAGLFLATNSLHVFYSQELRPYALPAMWACLSWWLVYDSFLKSQKNPQRSNFSIVFILYALITVLGLYSSYLYPFVIVTQLVAIALVDWSNFRYFLIATMAGSLSFLPWLPSLQEQLVVGGALRNYLPGWEVVVSPPFLKSFLLVWAKLLFGLLDLAINVPFFVTVVLFLLVLATAVWFNRLRFHVKTNLKKNLFITLLWLILPVMIAWIITAFIPILQIKRVLFIVPAWCLVLAIIARNINAQRLQVLFIVFLFSLNLYANFQYYLNPQLQREPWREAYRKITTEYPGGAVYFSFPGQLAPWQWYNKTNYPTYSTGVYTADSTDLAVSLSVLTEYRYILVFDYLRDLTDPQDSILKQLASFGYSEVAILDEGTLGFIRVYARLETVLSLNNQIKGPLWIH